MQLAVENIPSVVALLYLNKESVTLIWNPIIENTVPDAA